MVVKIEEEFFTVEAFLLYIFEGQNEGEVKVQSSFFFNLTDGGVF